MMTKFNFKYLFVFWAMVLSLMFIPVCKEAHALFDAGSMVSQVPNTIQQYANKVTTYANKVVKWTLQAYKSVQDFFKKLFSRKNTKVPGTKKIKESKVADIKSEDSIREAFPKLFFQYPSLDPTDQHKYEAKGEEFYEDTLIEAFTAVRELEKKLVQIDTQIAQAKTDYSQADDMNKGLENNYMINATTDQLMAIIQELVAIKSQLIAANAVHGEVDPLYTGDDQVIVNFNSK